MKYSYLLLFVLIVACQSGSNETANDRPSQWHGEWKAEWETPSDSPSYAGIEDMEFYMDGKFVFTGDSLTVQNNGYPGCIFAVDTLRHTQLWRVASDSLLTYNQPQTAGIMYKVKSFSDKRVELQLMDDIFITLTR